MTFLLPASREKKIWMYIFLFCSFSLIIHIETPLAIRLIFLFSTTPCAALWLLKEEVFHVLYVVFFLIKYSTAATEVYRGGKKQGKNGKNSQQGAPELLSGLPLS